MAANVEDFVTRLLRTGRKITFLFTEDFFNVLTSAGVDADRYKNIRNAVKNVGSRRGDRALISAGSEEQLFDVDALIVGTNFRCFRTTFKELATGPFGTGGMLQGFGGDMVDSQKARTLIETFFYEKSEQTEPLTRKLAEYTKRKLVLVVESPADLKRPSLDPVIALRSRKSTVLVNPNKGPIVDCQVAKISDCENSNSFSTLLSMLSAKY